MKGISKHIEVRFLPIKTVGLPFFQKMHAVLTQPRRFELTCDYVFRLPTGEEVLLPSGFDSDGTSIPRLLRWLIDPFGISLLPGIAHDFEYRHKVLLGPDREPIFDNATQWQSDDRFRRLNYATNDMPIMATLMYLMLRLFGRFAYRQHRKHDGTPRNDWRQFQSSEQ